MKKLLKPSIIPAIIWAFVLAWLMLIPSYSLPKSKLLSYDKLAHISLFSIQSFLVGWGMLTKNKQITLTHVLFILPATFVYSSALELLQQFVPGRMTDLYDFIANSVGGLLGVAVFYIFTQKKFAKLKLIL